MNIVFVTQVYTDKIEGYILDIIKTFLINMKTYSMLGAFNVLTYHVFRYHVIGMVKGLAGVFVTSASCFCVVLP